MSSHTNNVFRRVLAGVLMLVLAAPVTAVAAQPDPLSPAEVVEIERGLDGTVVVLEGEAIGEALRGDDTHVWVNVLGDGTAVGIWIPRTQADEIEFYGDHRHDGDIVGVSGVVNIACDEHSGEFDIHADTFEVLSVGFERTTSISPWKGIVGAIGILLFLAEWRLFRMLKERRLAT